MPNLTAVLTYRLTGLDSAFSDAAQSLAGRVRSEGHPGVRSYRFFLGPTPGQATAIVDYRDPDSWSGHHAALAQWPEMAALRRSASLIEVVFLGTVTQDMLDWMATAVPGAVVRHGAALVAGFVRA